MPKFLTVTALFLFLFADTAATAQTTALFNGVDLSGWQIYGTERWYVENGELVCESGSDKEYGYLGTDEVFTDFDLSLEFRQEKNGNSGVFFRSWVTDTIVEGWQVEVAPKGDNTGGVYESYGRGWLIKPDSTKDDALKEGDWNTMRVRVVGGHVTTWLNSVQMVDFEDNVVAQAKGRIALQIHSGGGIRVRWRHLEITRL